jgi:hypothetical protein
VAGRRFPWLKLWIEAVAHEKVALLSDAQFRTWVHTLCKGAEQPTRWHFASAQHAAVVSGRPLSHIKHLVNVRLLDQRDDGLWVHDFRQWQEVYESDIPMQRNGRRSVNTPPMLGEHSANTPPSVRTHSANAPTLLRDHSADHLPNTLARTRAQAKTGEGRQERGDEETRELMQTGPEQQQPEIESTAAAPPTAAEPSSDDMLDRVSQTLAAQPGWSVTPTQLRKLASIAADHDLDLELEALKIVDWLRSAKGRGRPCSFRFVANWLERKKRDPSTSTPQRNGSAQSFPPLTAMQAHGADEGYFERDWNAELGGWP